MLQHTQRAVDIKIKKIRDQDGRWRGEGPGTKLGVSSLMEFFTDYLAGGFWMDYMPGYLSSSSLFVFFPKPCSHRACLFQGTLSFNERRHPCYCVPCRVSTTVSELTNWVGGDPQGPTWSLQGKSLVCPKIVPWLTCCTAWHPAGIW